MAMSGDDVFPAATRTYNKVTVDMQAAVLAAKENLGPTSTYADVARLVNLPERTVKYILTDMPRLRRVAGGPGVNESLKARILHAVQALGPFRDVVALRDALGMADDEHDIVHCLHSLHKAGVIDFDERRREHPTDIRLQRTVKQVAVEPAVNRPPEIENPSGTHAPGWSRRKHAVGRDFTEPYSHGAVAQGGPVSVSRHTATDNASAGVHAEAQPLESIRPQADATTTTADLEGPEGPTHDNPPASTEPSVSAPDDLWPELSALATRDRDRMDAERRATVYQEAALAIEKLGDYAESERLMNRAAEVAPDAPTALEREILAFLNAVIRDHGVLPKP